MIYKNEKGEIIPHSSKFKIPILNVLSDGIDWNTNTELDLGYLRRSLYASGIASGKHIEHNHVFLSHELELARLRSNIVKYKQKDITVTMLWGDFSNKVYQEVCLYSEFKEFVNIYTSQFRKLGNKERYLTFAYSTETGQVFADNRIVKTSKINEMVIPNYPIHDNPKTAKKRMRKLNEGVEPEKISKQHKMNDPICDCETCQLIKGIHENYSR